MLYAYIILISKVYQQNNEVEFEKSKQTYSCDLLSFRLIDARVETIRPSPNNVPGIQANNEQYQNNIQNYYSWETVHRIA